MRPRTSLLEMFSTFLQFDHDRPQGWATDTRLRCSMQQVLQRSPDTDSENFWALHWYNFWKTCPQVAQPASPKQAAPKQVAEAHLSAYLQEACYWSAHRTIVSFTTQQYSLADCFQIAVTSVAKILKGFNAEQGFNLETYASAIFSSAIRDTLRQRQEIDICTNWGLLRKVSQKRLTAALQHRGFEQATIAQYLLAWTCFRTLYVPTQATANRQLPKPDASMWQAIAELYNRERQTASSQTQPSPAITPETLEKWLLTCAQAARSYLHPSVVSINTPKLGQESGELLDDVPESPRESLLSDLIAEEEHQQRQGQQTQLNQILETALTTFDSATRSLLHLYYAEALTQQQMAERLDMKQYTISRRLSRVRADLLTVVARWSQETLHIPLTTDVLNYTSIALEEWLQRYYSQPCPTSVSE